MLVLSFCPQACSVLLMKIRLNIFSALLLTFTANALATYSPQLHYLFLDLRFNDVHLTSNDFLLLATHVPDLVEQFPELKSLHLT